MKAAHLLLIFCLVVIEITYADPSIKSKSSWGGRPARGTTRLVTPVSRIYIHHTDTPSCSDAATCGTRLKSIQNHHMNVNKWSDIGYNFLIGGDAKVYEGRGWTTLGAHTKNHNSNAIGISFIGKHQTVAPTAAQMNTLNQLISFGVKNKYIKPNYLVNGHRDVVCTSCPGNKLYDLVKTLPKFDPNRPKPKC